MKVISRLTAVAAAVVLAAPMGVSAQALPKAEELFAKHVAAIGGKDVLSKITSMKTTGKFEMPAQGMTGEMETMTAAPNRMAVKITLPGLGEMQQGFDGAVAWDNNPMQGPRVLADKELQARKDAADFYGSMLYPPDRFTSAETVELTDFGGEKAYKVKCVLKSGREEMHYFSQASGLQIGLSATMESQMGVMEVVSTATEYKQFGAVKIPTKTEQSMGPMKMIVTITNVTFGDVPASAFALPDAVKALVKP